MYTKPIIALAVIMYTFVISLKAPESKNFNFSPPRHLSLHIFKSLNEELAPGESVYITTALTGVYPGSLSVVSQNLSLPWKNAAVVWYSPST